MKEETARHLRRPVRTRRVDECESLEEIFEHCLPAFGGGFARRIFSLLDQAIGSGCPLTLAVSGPVTVSGQHQAWLIPLLETGWVAYLSTTDAAFHLLHSAEGFPFAARKRLARQQVEILIAGIRRA